MHINYYDNKKFFYKMFQIFKKQLHEMKVHKKIYEKNSIGETVVDRTMTLVFLGVIFDASPRERMLFGDPPLTEVPRTLYTEFNNIAVNDTVEHNGQKFRVIHQKIERDMSGKIDHYKYYLTYTR